MNSDFNHIPVLSGQTLVGLNVRSGGIYIDATAGGGGHSKRILEKLENGRLFCIDRDPDAVTHLKNLFGDDKRVEVIQSNFSEIGNLNIAADGILFDFGVSSFQLDTPARGFSFKTDAPLDMRMEKSGTSAADIVNGYSEEQLSKILYIYGEERFSRQIAKNIVLARPISTTTELSEIIKQSVPAKYRREKHPAKKTFMALRIEVNGELSAIKKAIPAAFSLLTPGGRLAVITFHSIEDRLVKELFSEYTKSCACPKDFPVCVCGNYKKARIIERGIYADETEIQANRRSRSAKLRVLEKL